MAWTIEVSDYAEKQLRKLDKPIQKRLLDWLDDRIEGCKNPRHFGESLRGEMTGLWRYLRNSGPAAYCFSIGSGASKRNLSEAQLNAIVSVAGFIRIVHNDPEGYIINC